MEIISGLGLETELRLGLPGGERNHEKKRVFSDISSSSSGEDNNNNNNNNNNINNNKNQVVGWPPVAAFRRKNSFRNKMYVKVSMDGAPFLRKIDLSSHKCYSDLVAAVHELFGSSRIGGDTDDDGKYCEKVPIYEDKDGDWMLLGDVPWEMFIESCKRLRIMKGLDANGIGILQAKDLLKGLAKAEVSN